MKLGTTRVWRISKNYTGPSKSLKTTGVLKFVSKNKFGFWDNFMILYFIFIDKI